MDATAALVWLVGAAIAFGVFLFARRYGGGMALDQLRQANAVLEDTVRKQAAEIEGLRKRLGELEGKTDLTIALVPVLEQLKTHEHQAAARSEAMLVVLQAIAGKLGPAPA